MTLLSTNLLAPTKTGISLTPPSITLIRNPILFPSSPTPQFLKSSSQKRLAISASSSAATTTTTTTADLQLQEKEKSSESHSTWREFARRVSGEWDGFGAEFTAEGTPIELPESVVPEAFREWEVQVFDWQTQCPTLASETGDPLLSYRLIKLLPTVGCEADAATRYSVDERIAGGSDNKVSAFGYDSSGCYMAVWSAADSHRGERVFELEHCLVDPGNKEVRIRVIQVVRVEGEGMMRLERVRIFSEQWYGPFRNGEQLGGCAIRESGFASTGAVDVSEVMGVWEGTSFTSRLDSDKKDVFHELLEQRAHKTVTDRVGLVALPKNLWCSLKQKEDGETWGEVGWLVDNGSAIFSRFVLKDGRLKEMGIGQEIAAVKAM